MSRKKYGSYDPLLVFSKPLFGDPQKYIQTTLEDAILQHYKRLQDLELRHSLIRCVYKTTATEAGRMLEVKISPAFLDRTDYTRATKRERTPEERKRQNDKNAQQKLIRIIHSNFVDGDIAFTGTFSPAKQPKDRKECKRFIKNFFESLRYSSKQADAGAIKYVYVIEQVIKKDGSAPFHVHMIMSRNAGANIHGVETRDWIESKWKGGAYDNAKCLRWKQDRGGFTGMSKYMAKQFEELHTMEQPGLRHWGQSIGLKDRTSKPRVNHNQFSKRKVGRLVRIPVDIKAEFEKQFPGYEYLDCYPCEIRYSEVVGGFYLYCRMYRKE